MSSHPTQLALFHLTRYSVRHQVAPAEIEAILLSHPSVEDAAVKGVYSDHDATELVVAFITTAVPPSQQNVLKQDLHQLVNGKVAKYKRMSGGLRIIQKIPRK